MKRKYFLLFSIFLICLCKSGNSGNNITSEQERKPILNINITDKDSLIFNDLVNIFKNRNLSLNENIIEIGKFFIETPYIASTLDTDDKELLTVNLRQMDCVTFVEYVTSLALCFTNKKYTFDDFVEILTVMRYQSGIIDGYLSRLHYFSHWLQDNKDKGILDIISDSIGNAEFKNNLSFMSSNSHLYKQLNDTSLIKKLKAIEETVSTRQMKFISKSHIKNIENEINNGDIIAFVTSIDGLDVSHTGLAIKQNGQLHLLHASLTGKKVEITAVPLYDYILNRSNITGILVGRIK